MGLTLRDIPASVEVVTQQTCRSEGCTVSGSDPSGDRCRRGDHRLPPARFSMRVSPEQIRLLFDGLSLGPTGFVTLAARFLESGSVKILKGRRPFCMEKGRWPER
ncbi:MAG: hypothetical protein MRJ92_02850 [Nitrospira sp.]|nr:hypothetical protein [Nitrospira sp.]